MPGTQTESGKAFEYACLMSIVDFLKDVSIKIVEDKPFITARRSFDALNEDVQLQMRLAARAAIRMIYNLEPRLEHGSANYQYSRIRRVSVAMLEMLYVSGLLIIGKLDYRANIIMML